MDIKTDELGVPIFTFNNLFDVVYQGHADKIHDVQCEESPEVVRFNQAAETMFDTKLTLYRSLDIQKDEFDKALQKEWLIPEEYQRIDVHEYLKNKCTTNEEVIRVEQELEEYRQRNMFPVLRVMIFLVDFMRQYSIVWGVGRGSSVSSYVLYLIGVHRVNSIKYELDFREFLRNED